MNKTARLETEILRAIGRDREMTVTQIREQGRPKSKTRRPSIAPTGGRQKTGTSGRRQEGESVHLQMVEMGPCEKSQDNLVWRPCLLQPSIRSGSGFRA